jgi:hypothetical protein
MGSNPPKLLVEVKRRDEWFHVLELTGYEFFPSKDQVGNIFRSDNFKENIFPEDSSTDKGEAVTLEQMKDIDWEEEADIPEYLLEKNPEEVEDELVRMFKEYYNFYLRENDGERTEVRTRYLLNQMTEEQIDSMVNNQNFDKDLMRKLSDLELSIEEIQRLLKLKYLELEDTGTIEAEVQIKADFRPAQWNLLIDIMEDIEEFQEGKEYFGKDVRLHAYYPPIEESSEDVGS